MTKREKEDWTIQKFIKLFNDCNSDKLSLIRMLPSEEAPGPDFILKINSSEFLGVEVTTLYESTEMADQKNLQHKFRVILEEVLEKEKVMGISLVLYQSPLPSEEILVFLADRIVTELKKNLLTNTDKLPFEIGVDGQGIEVARLESNSEKSVILQFQFSVGGVCAKDRKAWVGGLEARMQEKERKGKFYLKDQPNWLVIYDNSNYGIYAYGNGVPQEIRPMISKEFARIFIFRGEKYFEIPKI